MSKRWDHPLGLEINVVTSSLLHNSVSIVLRGNHHRPSLVTNYVDDKYEWGYILVYFQIGQRIEGCSME